MNLPKGHLSPSQLNAWERCAIQYKIFTVEGAKAPPDFVLEAKRTTHEAILEVDLKQKIESGKNLADSDLSEFYRARMESQALAVAREDPNIEDEPTKAVETEIAFFDKIVEATRPWRSSVVPKQVEAVVKAEIGGVPVEGRLDLVAEDTLCEKIVDLKRQGSAPSKGSAANSRQLTTYAIATGLLGVGLAAIVETQKPKIVTDDGIITTGMIERVAKQYQVVAEEITDAIQKDRWKPVDISDPRKSWICTARFCSAWRIGSKDLLTGRDISCAYGERSVVNSK